jgi:hypothetical protein
MINFLYASYSLSIFMVLAVGVFREGGGQRKPGSGKVIVERRS